MNSKPPTDATQNPETTVFTLDDLQAWNFNGVSLAVLGHPVAHSISPAMHNAALAKMAEAAPRFKTWRYFKFDIPPGSLPRALPLLHRHGFHGVNLTIPHKTDVLPLLDDVDPGARRMGAVNTLRRRERGYEGFNSDGYGLSTAVTEELKIRLCEKPVVILGAGGAARAAAVQCLAENCPELWLGNRNPDRLTALLDDVIPYKKETTRLESFALNAIPENFPNSALIINATSVGLRPEDPSPVDLDRLGGDFAVFDMIYNPAETALIKAARRRGLAAANGLSMLIHQGVRSLEIWSGTTVPVEAMRRAAQAHAT